MHSLFTFSLVFLLGTCAYSQSRTNYVNPKFYSIAHVHRKVALLPFTTSIGLRPKERSVISDEALIQMEQKEGIFLQNTLASWLLRDQGRKAYRLEFQDINTTNALLLKAGLDIHHLSMLTHDELAKVLGVDALISGDIKTEKPISAGVAIVFSIVEGQASPTNTGEITINLNDAGGDLLWKYHKHLARDLGSNAHQIKEALLRITARKIPYGKMERLRKKELKGR